MAGGSKKKFNKPKSSYRNPSGGSIFIKGGILADWGESESPPPRGRKSSGGNGHGSGSRSGNGKGKVGSNPKSELARKIKGSEIGFAYPSTVGQRSTFNDDAEGEITLGNSQPMILLKSGDSSIVAYMDEGPFKSAQTAENTAQTVEYTCDYDKSFVLGDGSNRDLGFNDEAGNTLDDSSHRGLGFIDEAGQLGSGIGSFSLKEDKGTCSFEKSCSEKDIDADIGSETGISESDDELMDETSSVEENPGFLSIGGMRIYTQDIPDEDNDEEELLDEDSSGSFESEGSTGSSENDDSSYSGSDIDEEVAADYFEGIGGSGKIVNVDQLIGRMSCASDDNIMDHTSTGTLEEKLGGIALQDASREYGSIKTTPRRKYNIEDGLMFVKDPRTLSGRKKRAATYLMPPSFEAKQSNRSRRFPGEKKKCKETVAVKRRERMILRGVDPRKINLKLEKFVLDGIDIFSFQPMHHRDCAQVQRLADIYRLHSCCQNSGKKRFVTVTRTQHTSMPSPSDRARLDKLIGANDSGTDFTINDSSLRGKTTYKKALRDGISTLPKKSTKSRNDSSKKKKPDKVGSYAAQPISFVSCGIMDSAIVEVKNNESPDTSDSSHGKGASSSVEFGSFELHTTGFGSKMMAKMGFVEGGGLGKDGQGIAKPVEVSQRPKSLGLGADIPETSNNSEKKEHHRARADKISTRRKSAEIPETSNNSAKKERHRARTEKDSTRRKVNKNEAPSFGAFEIHTKGFGSKMMAKMGFVEGMGLGRDSQGIINPLEASRRPKGQGLGSRRR